jgi:hypothetical protein
LANGYFPHALAIGGEKSPCRFRIDREQATGITSKHLMDADRRSTLLA